MLTRLGFCRRWSSHAATTGGDVIAINSGCDSAFRAAERTYMTAMKFRLLLGPALAVLIHPVSAQRVPASAAPTGLWLTQDRGGVIAITQCADRLCARIVGVVLDHATDAMPVDYRGVSQCDLELINDARQVRPGFWKGHILDPRNGSTYGADLRLDSHGRFALRGFLGFSLLGHTETWTRYTGVVPRDCRLTASRNGEAESRPRPITPG